ncbi:hypothetical protein LR48_Vigan01g020100 [Vigna angularis]|uniref:Uncharacterized protein n=1 Tax=Phaseolus angularis TaxID=3914 RepID=A0A0L9TJP7_PHAAN|nr:hypothetical protein LR48_Vigan01g020100 [Vigna angularis]
MAKMRIYAIFFKVVTFSQLGVSFFFNVEEESSIPQKLAMYWKDDGHICFFTCGSSEPMMTVMSHFLQVQS